MTRRIAHATVGDHVRHARPMSTDVSTTRRTARETVLVGAAAAIGTLVPFVWFALAFWAMGLLTHMWNLG